MKIGRHFAGLLVVAMLGSQWAGAFETDQYSVPPAPLADIGDEVSEYVRQNIAAAVDKLDREIAVHEECLKVPGTKNCGSRSDEQKRLSDLRTDTTLAQEVFSRLGDGSLFVTKTGKWFNAHRFAHTPDRYKPAYKDSFYVFMPLDYATISPTVNIYGVETGWDKIEHLFQQGHNYFTTYRNALKTGKPAEDAVKAAVKWGKRTENTYFGLMVSGVYSNGDLVANYAGLKFYEGLTRELKLVDKTRPPLVKLVDGRWAIDSQAVSNENLIKPFVTDHMNEALNPSIYSFNLYPTVKRVVTNADCPKWRDAFPQRTAAAWNHVAESLTTWNGEDYGWKKGDRMFPIARCFNDSLSD